MWLLMKTEAAGCAYENAEALARYEGFTPGTNVQRSVYPKAAHFDVRRWGLGLETFEPRLGCCA